MILIVSNSIREASLLATLCEQHSWPCEPCSTISGFIKMAENTSPKAIVLRHRLNDGYSDDVFAWLKKSGRSPATKVVILVPANCSASQEARQVALGADCVLRDPVRLEVLFEYLAKYRNQSSSLSTGPQMTYLFAGAKVLPHECRLTRATRSVSATPKVMDFLRVLYDSANTVVPYPALYAELFNRKFSGETANSRMLLAKAAATFQGLGIDIRRFITVIPKIGYLYTPLKKQQSPTKNRPKADEISTTFRQG
jgi:DNA-binding response OmpR family regulator